MGTVLLILKIIGIILLGLLGFILTAALLLVFYPVSYKLLASYEDKAVAKLKVHWLFHLISVTLDYKDGKKKCVFRLFGIPLMDFLNPKPQKNRTKKAKKPKSKKQKTKKQKTLPKDYADEAGKTVETAEEAPSLTSNTSAQYRQAATEEAEADVRAGMEGADGEEEVRAESKIKALWQKVVGFFQRIIQVIADICQKIRDAYTKGVNLKEKLDKWIEVLERERTRQAIDKAKNHIISIVKHVMPRKWKAFVLFGFEDPALTGKIAGYYWMFIGLWGEHFICTPDFEHKVLKGTLEAKGHIQAFKFIYIAYKFMFDKDLVYLRKIKDEVDS